MPHKYFRSLFKLRSCRRTKALVLPALGTLLAATLLQGFGMGLWSSQHIHAQQPSQDAIIATTLFETQFEGPAAGPATVSVATITMKPGQATLPLEGRGSLMILVESGSVILLIDHAIDGLSPLIKGDNASALSIMYRLRAGERVTIPSIEKIQFRNEGDETSNLLLLALVSEGGPSLPEVMANS